VTITNAAGAITIAATGGGGTGDVVGPASSTDNAFARFDSTTGKLLQNSTGATLSDTGAAVFTGALDVLGNSTAGSNIKLYEDTDNGTNYVAFKAPDTIASNVTWTLPAADGTSAQVLQTNGSGTLSFATVSGGSATPAGSNTQVQFNNAGAFGASSSLTFDGTTLATNKLTSTGFATFGFGGVFTGSSNNASGVGVEIGYGGGAGYVQGFNRGTGQYDPLYLDGSLLTFNIVGFEKARINTNGLGLGGATPSSGTGITFPATQSASSNANTLDDYEEGTWTCGITTGSGSITMNTSFDTGEYTKVGRLVTITGEFRVSSVSSPSGTAIITLPFTVAAATERSTYATTSLWMESASQNMNTYFMQIAPSTTSMYIYAMGTNSYGNAANNFSGDELLFISVTYMTT
jgi:hypothetical protein